MLIMCLLVLVNCLLNAFAICFVCGGCFVGDSVVVCLGRFFVS